MISTEFLGWKKVGSFSPMFQAIMVGILYVLMTLLGYLEYKKSGTVQGYPLSLSLFFVPIYEEILFRGFVLGYLEKQTTWVKATSITSIVFALWHLKNIFFLSPIQLLYQIAYGSLIISPLFCYITLRTRTIWPAVILHYANNLWAPISWIVMARLLTH